MVNILCYWDVVKGHPNAVGVTAGLPATTVVEYLGYFMDTNDIGSPARVNPIGHSGTLDVDIIPGTGDFVRWDIANPPHLLFLLLSLPGNLVILVIIGL